MHLYSWLGGTTTVQPIVVIPPVIPSDIVYRDLRRRAQIGYVDVAFALRALANQGDEAARRKLQAM